MARNQKEPGARIEISRKMYLMLKKAGHTQFDKYERDWEYRGNEDGDERSIRVPAVAFGAPALQCLLDYLQETSAHEHRWMIGHVSAHLAAEQDPDMTVIKKLEALETALRAWVRKDAIRGWIFKRDDDGTLQPLLVNHVKYHPAETGQGYRTPAHVDIDLRVWGPNERSDDSRVKHERVKFEATDLQPVPLKQLLLDAGVLHETSMLINLYDRDEKRFLQWRSMLGAQFVGNGTFSANDPDREDRFSHRAQAFDAEMLGTRLVIDDDAKAVENRMESELFADAPTEQDAFTQLPLELCIDCFNLRSHRNGWVHISEMKPYVYRPELREKLILPEQHSDLIDALTSDMDVLQEDIIEGKTGGTAILCQGKAGTGKTLTAEIYSEIVQRPLYRVHSGQLGTSPVEVEAQLQAALDRATRWKAVLLIDEADVFIMQRGNDLQMNAVVGVFLRLLEYYSGLLFLTTNRLDVIDEAILSRCVAIIRYSEPEIGERQRLWEVLGKQYGLDLVNDRKALVQLAAMFKCTGRDIKGLTRLVMKYARVRKKEPTVEDFKRFATFKGIKVNARS